ncbi:MAG: hypothetical protein NUW21_08155 [Elusimicrobia bacterium]|nr:hypothetical protein [Elusimicrobiota bacterium]
MTIPYGNWLASTSEEEWDCLESWPTREEAIEHGPAALGLEPGRRFWVGRCARPDTECVGRNLARCVEDAVEGEEDFGGDWAADWPDKITVGERRDLAARLNGAFRGWLGAYPRHIPGWFVVRDPEAHEAAAEPARDPADDHPLEWGLR